jgi:putative PEP-CTERM system TPR-repeat lipoprotein
VPLINAFHFNVFLAKGCIVNSSSTFRLCVVAFACALVVGCGAGEDPDKLVASAKEYLQKNDPQAAVIQLKNALQKKPDIGEARFLLGKALLDGGDAPLASIELRKALDLKYSAEDVVPVLARALVLEGQGAKAIELYATTQLTDPQRQAELKTALASAYSTGRDLPKAQAALATALQLSPKLVPALLMQARLAASARDFDGALGKIDKLLDEFPSEVEAWQLKGDLLAATKADGTAALPAYRKVLELRPASVPALAGIVAVHLSKGDLAEAEVSLESLKKIQPKHPQTQYFVAQLAFQKRDYKTAKELLPALLSASPDNVRVLQLAGATELYGDGSLAQAETHLSKVLHTAPQLVLARRMLVQTYLRSGQSAKALTTLEPLLALDKPDAQALAFAGEAHLQAGNAAKAESYFAQAAKINPDDARSRTVLALAQLSRGAGDVAFGELQNIAESDKGATANLALISAFMRRNELDRALKAIDDLEKKQPDKPLAANLRGLVHLARKNFAAARQSFEKALTIDPLFFPAASSLAALDLAEKKPDDAQKRFEAMLTRDPKNAQTLLALAGLKAGSGATKEEVTASLKKVVETIPDQVAPRLVLIDHYLSLKEFKQAAVVAQEASTKFPERIEILESLGRAQLASGDLNQASKTFNNLARLQPQSALPHVRLAEVHMSDQKPDAAAQSLKRALAITPDLIAAQNGLIRLDSNAGRINEALAMAKTVQKQRPSEAIGYIFEGDIEAKRKAWDVAIAAYREGLKKAPSAELATKLHSVFRVAGKSGEADKFAASWIKERPNDVAFEFYLGDVAVASKDYPAAEAKYKRVLQMQPDNPTALNNLAWVSSKLKRDGALAYAEKADSLRPNQPAFLDTLAMLQSEAKQYNKAIETQKKALSFRPDDPVLRLGLARIYIAAGDKASAKPELEALRKLGSSFSAQDEVGELLGKL